MRLALTWVALALCWTPTGAVRADSARVAAAAAAGDPLPSWNDGPAKTSIIDFVAKVTKDGQGGSPDFVKPAERIAVFDNDGTLWCEQPTYAQLAFVFDRIKALAPEHPVWKDKEPYKSVLPDDLAGVKAAGVKGMLELTAATHAGITTEEFDRAVREWLKTARHPTFDRPYTELTYQPMLEVLTYLRANGFKTFIVSGGGVEFVRAFAEEVYGIPPEQVIGSSTEETFELRDGKPVLMKGAKLAFLDDGPGKPIGINNHIGRRPVMAFGNSDGDLQMLQWTTARDGPRFALVVHHTDAEREAAYDRQSQVGKLDKALDEAAARGWTVVDMRRDWKAVFPSESRPPHPPRAGGSKP